MTFTIEVETQVSASRMFKAGILNWYNLGPKVVPKILARGTEIEGDGGLSPGPLAVMPFTFVKERLDFVDHANFECKSTAIEGGHLGRTLKSASAHFKIVPTSNGGCICKVVTETKLLPGADAGDDEAKAKDSFIQHFKITEAYLLANPDAYA